MGPRTKPKPKPVFVPHPDDVDEVQAGLDAAERDDALSPEESEAYVRRLLADDVPDK